MRKQDYSQPDFYHFSEDVIKFSDFLVQKYSHRSDMTVVDLFAGSGVLGIEFFNKTDLCGKLIAIEKQIEFTKHLKENLKRLKSGIKSEVILSDIERISLPENADLFVFNPPFYEIGEGRTPNDLHKKACHFMEQITWDRFVLQLHEIVGETRECFFIMRANSKLIKNSNSREYIEEVSRLNEKVSVFKIQ